MAEAILVIHKEHDVMLATWPDHRGGYIGVKATGDTNAPICHGIIEPGTFTKWMKVG
jgi:hypothetical protein